MKPFSEQNKENISQTFLEIDFTNLNLAGVLFENCTFTRCLFKETSFAKTHFVDCLFTSSDLSNLDLTEGKMREISFVSCKLFGLQWTQLNKLVNPSFKECKLDYANFLGLKLKKTVFYKCSLREVDFSEADLSECDFRESDFLNARFQNTTLIKSDFRSAINYLIDPVGNKVKGAYFSLPEAQGLLYGLGVIIEN